MRCVKVFSFRGFRSSVGFRFCGGVFVLFVFRNLGFCKVEISDILRREKWRDSGDLFFFFVF